METEINLTAFLSYGCFRNLLSNPELKGVGGRGADTQEEAGLEK